MRHLIHNGFRIVGECAMIDRYGNIYDCLDNCYHPNPGTEETQYSEIERTIDWLYSYDVTPVKPLLDKWIANRVANVYGEIAQEYEDVLVNVMYCDAYEPCQATKDAVHSALSVCETGREAKEMYLKYDYLDFCRQIVSYLNENFMRVRCNGKLNPEGADIIVFRISSHGYDWSPIIRNFLWEVFHNVDSMPKGVWIGYDAETHPPEKVLYDGTSKDLIEKYDAAIFATTDADLIFV